MITKRIENGMIKNKKSDAIKYCRECGDVLVVGTNISQGHIDGSCYICIDCSREINREYQRNYQLEHVEQIREYNRKRYKEFNREQRDHKNKLMREYLHRAGISNSMNTDITCSAYLGVHVAERVLSKIFKNVEMMPYGNPGYDFVCGQGYLVDAKCSCRHKHSGSQADNWIFNIRKNHIADYFLCLAFDDRISLNPENIWLIPGNDINQLYGASISVTTLHNWSEYEIDKMDQVIECCNVMRRQ